ncbi:MAG: hypothetical protein CMF51_04950 [Legionellales bacterium]|nr:hypothetical protein [Legionellales bacterium]
MRQTHGTESTQPSGSTGSSNWRLPIIGITLFTTISALGGVELFNGKLTLGGVSTTAISGLIAFMAMSALCLICWGASKWVEGENTNRHMGDFLNFIKNSSISIVASAVISASAVIIGLVTKGTGTTLSSVISGLVTKGAGITLSFLQNTPLSAIAATTPLSTFLVGTVVLTIALPALYLILKALGQCAANQAQKIASSLKEAWQANGSATGETEHAPLSSSQANGLATGETKHTPLSSSQAERGMIDSGIIVSDKHDEDNLPQPSL